MNILITGGSGFIGSHIADRFINDGSNVTVLDMWESDESKVHDGKPNFNFVKGSILTDGLVESIIVDQKIDSIIHLAAILGTSETITTYDVENVAETNVMGTVKILNLCKKHDVKRICIPTTPDVTWINPYKITKAAIEKFAQLFSENYGVEAVCLKLGNIYGARERWLDGPKEAPYNYQKVIPTILMETLRGNAFPIYGDGEQKSEYIYVGDVVESFYRAIMSDKNLGGEIIHVGAGRNYSVNQIIDAVERVWSKPVNRNYVDMRPGEHFVEITLNPEPLKTHLDYELQWSLDEGLVETIKYYEDAFRRLG